MPSGVSRENPPRLLKGARKIVSATGTLLKVIGREGIWKLVPVSPIGSEAKEVRSADEVGNRRGSSLALALKRKSVIESARRNEEETERKNKNIKVVLRIRKLLGMGVTGV